MVKLLSDMCLGCIEKNLHNIKSPASRIPTYYKELLIERLASHDLFHDSYLPYIASSLFCENLRKINLYKCQQVTDESLRCLATSNCQLEVLTIHNCSKVTDAGVMAITFGQTELCVLELRKLPDLTAKGLLYIESPKLWKLDLRGCPSITSEGIASVVQKNPSIKVLVLVSCSKLDESVFKVLASGLGPELEELDTGLHTATDNSLLPLAEHCPNLKKLNLHGCTKIGKEGLIKLFQGCTKLESLDLSYCNRLRQNPESEALWTLPQTLNELSLCGILLEDEDILVECLQRLKSLKSVRLNGVSALNDNTLEKILQHVGSNLISLDISGGFNNNITDDGLRAVAKYCTNLESLCLSLLTEVTCITLSPIFKDPERAALIKEMFLSCKMIDLNVLFLLATSCTNLNELHISGLTCVTDDLLYCLAENCHHLSFLGIKGCKQVTDAAVCELARCCPLRHLVLSGIKNLTDKSIFALANSNPYLQMLFLNGCSQISPMAVTYLNDCCVSRLSVQHCTPNVVPDQLMAKNLDTGEFCRADLLQTS